MAPRRMVASESATHLRVEEFIRDGDLVRRRVLGHREGVLPWRLLDLRVVADGHPHLPAFTPSILAVVLVVGGGRLPVRVAAPDPNIQVALAALHAGRVDTFGFRILLDEEA